VAFYAIGAYGLALGYQYLGLGFWAMLPLGAIMAALAGALLGFPVLRMHGDYLAIVTLGFGEIIRLVLNNWVSFTGGPNGVPSRRRRCLASSLAGGPKMAACPSMSFCTSATTPT
jgi:branched-chain amino acid transport system permease protein